MSRFQLPQLSIAFVWRNWPPKQGMVLHAGNPSYSQGQIKRTAELKGNLGNIAKLCLRWKQKTKFWKLMMASPGVSQLWKPKSKLTSFMAPAALVYSSPKLFTERPLHLGHSCEMELSFKHVALWRRGTRQRKPATLQWGVSWPLKPKMAGVPGARIRMHGPCRSVVICMLGGSGGR